MPTFGERLKLLRTEKSIKQTDLAQEMDISPRALRYYEDDQREPNLKAIKFLTIYFDVSADFLLGFSDIRKP